MPQIRCLIHDHGVLLKSVISEHVVNWIWIMHFWIFYEADEKLIPGHAKRVMHFILLHSYDEQSFFRKIHWMAWWSVIFRRTTYRVTSVIFTGLRESSFASVKPNSRNVWPLPLKCSNERAREYSRRSSASRPWRCASMTWARITLGASGKSNSLSFWVFRLKGCTAKTCHPSQLDLPTHKISVDLSQDKTLWRKALAHALVFRLTNEWHTTYSLCLSGVCTVALYCLLSFLPFFSSAHDCICTKYTAYSDSPSIVA